MPTILAYLNYDKEFIAFGNNLFDDSRESFAFNTNGNTYHLYTRDHLLEMIDFKPVGLFNYRNDRLLGNNLMEKEPGLTREMVQKLKAIIQSYNTRLIDNDLVIRDQLQGP
jgi:hypothetical protein